MNSRTTICLMQDVCVGISLCNFSPRIAFTNDVDYTTEVKCDTLACMNQVESPTNLSNWGSIAHAILHEGKAEECRPLLEFLASYGRLGENDARACLPLIQKLVYDPEAEVRYFARKASQRLLELYPSLRDRPSKENGDFASTSDERGAIPPRDILLRKLRLGSRYVVFEAIDRLTESGDAELFNPLVDYLQQETDMYKVSYLLRRISRIPDPRVPDLLVKYLENHDYRVIANALEGLAEISTPQFKERFAEMSKSPDHRVRAAAIRALFRYDRQAAKAALEGMMRHESIAFQEAAMYVLRQTMADDLEPILDMALHSQFPSIRLAALEITGNNRNLHTSSTSRSSSQPCVPPTSELHQERGLLTALVLTLFLMTVSFYVSHGMLLNIYLIIAALYLLINRHHETNFARAVASAAFIACLVWGDVQYLPLLGLLAIWLPIPGSGRDGKSWLPRILTWTFVILAVFLSHSLRDENLHTLDFISTLITPTRRPDAALEGILTQVRRLRWFFFGIITAGVTLLLKLDRWLPIDAATSHGKKRRLVGALMVSLLILLVVLAVQSFGVRMWLTVNGMSTPNLILKHLGD